MTQELQERTSVAFKDPTYDGLDKISNTNWIKDTLSIIECDGNLVDEKIQMKSQSMIMNSMSFSLLLVFWNVY